MRFNNLIIGLRFQALAGVAGISVLAGLYAGTSDGGDPSKVLGGVFLLPTFFWAATWLLDHHYYSRLLDGAVAVLLRLERDSFRLQPIDVEQVEWWQDGGNIFYLLVLVNTGIVLAAVLAALLCYVFGYGDYQHRRKRNRLTRQYIEEGLNVYVTELTSDVNQTMNTLYAAQDWLRGDVPQTEELYLASLAPETRAIETVALTRTKDLFQHDELTKALLQLQMNLRVANDFTRRELPQRLRKGGRKADLDGLNEKTSFLISSSGDVSSQIGELTQIFEKWLFEARDLSLSEFRSDREVQQRVSKVATKVSENVASREELSALFPENSPR